MCSAVLNLPVTSFEKHKSHLSLHTNDFSSKGIKITPLLIDFGQLLKSTKKTVSEAVPGISNLDLLHGAATLYGVSLSEITDDVIYPLISGKWTKTLLLILDAKQAEEKTKKSLMTFSDRSVNVSVPAVYDKTNSLYERRLELKKSESENCFVNIFSDDESNSEADSDEEFDYTKSIDKFLHNVDERRKARLRWFEMNNNNLSLVGNDGIQAPPLGIENRLIACATFERSYEWSSEKVFFLSLLAVRKKFRGFGIGSFIMRQILNSDIVGEFDAFVVNADVNCVDFFEMHGFSDDIILNSRYAYIGEKWFDSKQMCYLKKNAKNQKSLSDDESHFNLKETEMELIQSKERNAKLYHSHSSIVQQMRNEILTLHAHLGNQDQTISQLQLDLNNFSKSQILMHKENMKKMLKATQYQSSTADTDEELPSPLSIGSHVSGSFYSAKSSIGSMPALHLGFLDQSKEIVGHFDNITLESDESERSNFSTVQSHVSNKSNNLQMHHPTATKDNLHDQFSNIQQHQYPTIKTPLHGQPSNVHMHKSSKTATHNDSQPGNVHLQKPSKTIMQADSQPSKVHTHVASKITVSADSQPSNKHMQKPSKITHIDHQPSNVHTHESSRIATSADSQPSSVHTHKSSQIAASADSQPSNVHLYKASKTTAQVDSQPSNVHIHKSSRITTSDDSQPSNVHLHKSSKTTAHVDSQPSNVHIHKASKTTSHADNQPSNEHLHKASRTTAHADSQPSQVHIHKSSRISTTADSQPSNVHIQKPSKTIACVDSQPSNVHIHKASRTTAHADSQPSHVHTHKSSGIAASADSQSSNVHIQKSSKTTSHFDSQPSNVHIHKASKTTSHTNSQLSNEHLQKISKPITHPNKVHTHESSRIATPVDSQPSNMDIQKLSKTKAHTSSQPSNAYINANDYLTDTTRHRSSISKSCTSEPDSIKNKNAYSDLGENEFLNFVGQSTDEFCIFAQSYSEKFEKFAQKSSEEFRSFVKQSSDEFRSFFLYEIQHCFLTSISEKGSTIPFDKTEVIEVIPAEVSYEVTSRYNEAVRSSYDPNIIANLYFCGSEHHHSHSDSFCHILKNGFGFDDFVESEFGKGLHFSRHASTASYFSPTGHVLVAKVCLGLNKTLTKKNSRRQHAPEGYDSILTPGRLADSHYTFNDSGVSCSEYIIFDSKLVVPLAIIKFKVLQ